MPNIAHNSSPRAIQPIVLTMPQIKNIVVSLRNGHCYAVFDNQEYMCSVGKNGIAHSSIKTEGDQKTPSGFFHLREIFYRADRISLDESTIQLPIKQLSITDGWCDDPKHPDYNKFVNLRIFDNKISHENLWREDNIYDIIVVVGYNDVNIIPGKGSAIFIHIARNRYNGTAGCIAFSKKDLMEILPKLTTNTKLVVQD